MWLYGLFGLVPLAWRDEAPLTVFTTQWVLTVAAWLITMPRYIPMAGITVALYSVSVHYDRRVSLLALLASSIPIGLDLAAVYNGNHPGHAGHAPFEAFVTNAVILVVAAGWAWGLGRATQANQRRLRNLERERESAREAEVLSTERRRIARELHDIVSHAVTVIILQAAGAARVAKTDFTQVIRSLTHIETTGKQAMAELRRLLGVLEDSNATSTGEFKPQPGLADLPELLASLKDAGMSVNVQTVGTPLNLDSSIDLTAYRIVQEGLVNVLKHAGKHANPRLRLAWDDHSLLIQIDNDTTVTRATHSGQTHPGQACPGGRGLVGLRERAHAAGGNLHAGPHRQGGYRLTATIPLATPGVSPVPRASHKGRGDQGKVSV
ncbi:MAG: histidine kinase [Pseudonocardiaceae bacterium]